VLSAGRPVTLTPLDVTQRVAVDESHAAHLAASGSRHARVLAEILGAVLASARGDGGRCMLLHDPVSVGGLLWPQLFVRTRARLEVQTSGPRAGQCRPVLGGDAARQTEIHTSVKAVDLLENMFETICHERFVV
jgi:inosine-uridine nucleoside N-ribohydrolase